MKRMKKVQFISDSSSSEEDGEDVEPSCSSSPMSYEQNGDDEDSASSDEEKGGSEEEEEEDDDDAADDDNNSAPSSVPKYSVSFVSTTNKYDREVEQTPIIPESEDYLKRAAALRRHVGLLMKRLGYIHRKYGVSVLAAIEMPEYGKATMVATGNMEPFKSDVEKVLRTYSREMIGRRRKYSYATIKQKKLDKPPSRPGKRDRK